MEGSPRPARGLRGNGLVAAGATVVLAVLAAALAGPLIAPYDPARPLPGGLDASGLPQPPGGRFLLGTDPQGRDTLSRLLHGARPSLAIGAGAAALALGIGLAVGLAAGYRGGLADAVLMRLTDMMMAFPAILLVVALAAVVPRRTVGTSLLVVGAVSWTLVARVVRAETLALREQPYVEAARALGASHARIVIRHIVPQLAPTLMVMGSLGMATTLLLDAGLSYLGLGLPLEQPSWGQMLRDGQSYYRDAPWVILWPAMAVMVTVAGFNMMAFGAGRMGRQG